MNISYHRLFNLKISHDYYKDGLAKGVHLMPTQDTVEQLKNGRMLLKKLQHQTVVSFRTLNENPPVDPPNPFITLEEDFKFTFALTVDNKSEFINISNLDVNPMTPYESSNILYFNNDPANASDDPLAPENLNFSLLDSIRNALFTYAFQLDPAPVSVDLHVFPINDDGSLGSAISVGKEVDGSPLPNPISLDRDIPGIGKYSQSIDLRIRPTGRYKVIITNVGADPLVVVNRLKEEDIYVHDELASQRILGVVDIIYEAPTAGNPTYKKKEEYNIAFIRKQTFWKYFLVFKTPGSEANTYEIDDTLTSPIPGTSYAMVNFADVTPVGQTINGKPAKVFISNNAIEFFELPKVNINLNDTTNTKTVIANLANASPENVVKKNKVTSNLESEIYVFL